MSEIINYFIHPEISMSMLLSEDKEKKWLKGLKGAVLLAILVGLLTITSYKLLGYDFNILSMNPYYEKVIGLFESKGIIEGFTWLGLVGIEVIITIVLATFRMSLWIMLLYLVSRLLGEAISIEKIMNISVYSILSCIAVKVFTSVILCIGGVLPEGGISAAMQEIQDVFLGLGEIFSYWYLILFIIGYGLATNSTFKKSGIVVLGIQGVFWMLTYVVPVLGNIVG